MGWNPGQKAAMRQVMLKTDPGAYFYGRLDDHPSLFSLGINNGTTTRDSSDDEDDNLKIQEVKEEKPLALEDDRSIVSMISAIRFGEDQAWLSYYITEEKYRGCGYGLATFNRALEHVGHSRKSVGLNAVFAQVENYRKSGFTKSSWTNERRRGSARDVVEVQERELADRIGKNQVEGLVLLSDPRVDWEQLPAMEKRYAGFNRPEFVKDWVRYHANYPEHHRVGVAFLSPDKTDPITGKPLVLGYACARPAVVSYRIGPLYATDGEVARNLLVKLSAEVVAAEIKSPLGVPLIFDIDIVQQNEAAMSLFDKVGWPNVISSLRMWKGEVPPYDASGVFGISTAEAG
ncbi:hypothetical protein BGX24_011862 [Mortierella sp. AD032]|nr:hypothetical protein BGX24_011862 [Mortierella sp. AD032]